VDVGCEVGDAGGDARVQLRSVMDVDNELLVEEKRSCHMLGRRMAYSCSDGKMSAKTHACRPDPAGACWQT
jgi:hypothetical protein